MTGEKGDGNEEGAHQFDLPTEQGGGVMGGEEEGGELS